MRLIAALHVNETLHAMLCALRRLDNSDTRKSCPIVNTTELQSNGLRLQTTQVWAMSKNVLPGREGNVALLGSTKQKAARALRMRSLCLREQLEDVL